MALASIPQLGMMWLVDITDLANAHKIETIHQATSREATSRGSHHGCQDYRHADDRQSACEANQTRDRSIDVAGRNSVGSGGAAKRQHKLKLEALGRVRLGERVQCRGDFSICVGGSLSNCISDFRRRVP